MRVAYADPPYLGCCRLYGHFHPDGKCWDQPGTHQALIAGLLDEFPDGWALSASSTSLAAILLLCPPEARIAAWVKPFCAFKRGVRPCYSWEPVIFWRGRNPPRLPHLPPARGGPQTTSKDFLAEPIALRRGLTGANPERFCSWVLDLLNVQHGDQVIDLFPGTGVMGRVAHQRTSSPANPCLAAAHPACSDLQPRSSERGTELSPKALTCPAELWPPPVDRTRTGCWSPTIERKAKHRCGRAEQDVQPRNDATPVAAVGPQGGVGTSPCTVPERPAWVKPPQPKGEAGAR